MSYISIVPDPVQIDMVSLVQTQRDYIHKRGLLIRIIVSYISIVPDPVQIGMVWSVSSRPNGIISINAGLLIRIIVSYISILPDPVQIVMVNLDQAQWDHILKRGVIDPDHSVLYI